MNIATRISRLVALALCATLAACGTAQLDVDLTVSGAFDADRLKANVAAIELLDESGDLHQLDLAVANSDEDDQINFTEYQDGSSLRLAEDAELPTGRYTGIRLRLQSPITLRLKDGSSYTLTQSATGPFAALDLQLGDGESSTLLAVLDLRFSLADQRSSTGSFDFAPVLSGHVAEDSASIGGSISSAALDAAGCRNSGGELLAGAAIYVFAGSGATPTDYARIHSPNPVASTLVQADSDAYRYALPNLAPGSYTLALTCQADADSADSTNALDFSFSRSITLDDADAATLNISN